MNGREIGNRRVRGHGLHVATIELPVGVLDAHVSLVEATEPRGAKVDIPEAVGNLLQPHVITDAHGRDIHPPGIPPDAAIGTDVADSKRSGYSRGGTRAGIGRGDGT